MSDLENIHELKALIIDKSDFSTGIAKKCLAGLGVNQIEICSSIPKALKLIGRDSYNLVICEYNLSTEYMGSTLLEQLRERSGFNTSFVMTSSDNTREAVLDILQYNPDELLLKPYTLDELKSRLYGLCLQHLETIDIRESMKSGDIASVVRLSSDTYRQSLNSKNWLIRAKLKALEEKKLYRNMETFCRFVLQTQNLEWVRTSLVKSLVKQKEYDVAIDEAKKASKHYPNSVAALIHMADAYRGKGMMEEASKVYSNVLKLTSRSKQAQRAYSELCTEMGKYDVAVESYKKLMRLLESTMSETEDAYIELANSTKEQAENDFDIEISKALTEAITVLKRGESRFQEKSSMNLDLHQEIFALQKLYEEGREFDAKEGMKALLETHKRTFMQSSSGIINAIITLRTMKLHNEADNLIFNIEHNKEYDTIKSMLDRRMKAIRNGGNENIVKIDRLRRESEQLVGQGNLLQAVQRLKEAVVIAPSIASLHIKILEVCTSYSERFKVNSRIINDCKNSLSSLHGMDLNDAQLQTLLALETKFDQIELRYIEQRRKEKRMAANG
ncbi:response regulator [Vibrio harveyi]|uniref:response regulator n=1 Tax=Vibrio harveyi TaxID=669 RepID=UPI003CEC13F8